jgi:hypothetical protein
VSFLHIFCLIVAPNPCHLVSVTPIINSFLSSEAVEETSACHLRVSFLLGQKLENESARRRSAARPRLRPTLILAHKELHIYYRAQTGLAPAAKRLFPAPLSFVAFIQRVG